MDMPIKIIITLSIAIVVSVILINFSKAILDSADSQISAISEKDEAEKIIEMEDYSAKELAYIAEECLRMGDKEEKDITCFALYRDSSTPVNEGDIESHWTSLGYGSNMLDFSYSASKEYVLLYYYSDPKKIKIVN